jgi:hypothetical protein
VRAVAVLCGECGKRQLRITTLLSVKETNTTMTSQSGTSIPLAALVFGASGVTGHGIIKTLLSYPTPTTFSRVIGLTNRPLSSATARLPEDERLELYSEINLLKREQSLLQLQHIPGIQQVTHVYYAAYAGHGESFEELKRINNELLTNAIGGVEICCPALQFVTLNTGGKVRPNDILPPEDCPQLPNKTANITSLKLGLRHRIRRQSPLQPTPPRRPPSHPRALRQQHLLLLASRHPRTRERQQTLVIL